MFSFKPILLITIASLAVFTAAGPLPDPNSANNAFRCTFRPMYPEHYRPSVPVVGNALRWMLKGMHCLPAPISTGRFTAGFSGKSAAKSALKAAAQAAAPAAHSVLGAAVVSLWAAAAHSAKSNGSGREFKFGGSGSFGFETSSSGSGSSSSNSGSGVGSGLLGPKGF